MKDREGLPCSNTLLLRLDAWRGRQIDVIILIISVLVCIITIVIVVTIVVVECYLYHRYVCHSVLWLL